MAWVINGWVKTMTDKTSSKGIYLFGAITLSILLMLYIGFVFVVVERLQIQLLLIGFELLFVLIGIIIIYLLRKKITLFSNSLNYCLDDMIIGKENIDFDLDKETLLAKLQMKLNRLYEIMKGHAKQSIAEKAAIQSLVSDISHQVKTPISNIKMYNSILQDRPVTLEKQQEFLQAMAGQIDKLDFLIQAMVKMSRLETGVLEIKPQLVSVYETVAQALSGIMLNAELKNISVSVECDEMFIVSHDPKWTVEALFNILDNAVKYTPAKGKITLSVSRWEFYTKVDIADTGKGIAETNQAAIFKRFYREPEVHDQAGIGIGLYLAREIITMQGGYVEVKSLPEHGSTFSVFLPN